MANRITALSCPKCSYAYSKADNGKASNRSYRRARRCLKCDALFVTYEIMASDFSLLMEFKRWVALQKPVADD